MEPATDSGSIDAALTFDLNETIPSRRGPVAVALVVALSLHGVVILTLKTEKPRRLQERTISVQLQQQIIEEAVEEDINEVVEEIVPPEPVEVIEDVAVTPAAQPPPPESTTETTITTTGPSGTMLYQRALEFARELPPDSAETTGYDETTVAYPETIPKMVHGQRRVESRDVNGMHTVLLTDRQGRTSCWQQRGFAGDGNPPLWYRIPVSTCGHLQ